MLMIHAYLQLIEISHSLSERRLAPLDVSIFLTTVWFEFCYIYRTVSELHALAPYGIYKPLLLHDTLYIYVAV